MWQKLGQIFSFDRINDDLQSHAANPLPIHLHENTFRVFFSSRDKENRSSVGYVDIDLSTLKVTSICDRTIIRYGSEDSFYAHGISIGNHYQVGPTTYVLFMAWQNHTGQHWRGDVGRIQLVNKEEMIISPNHPYMTSDEIDPLSLSYPWVMKDGNIYRMYYGSTLDWTSENGEMIHVIQYAESLDGEKWNKKGLAVPYEIGVAQAFSHPTVHKDEKGYHMWYSYRSGDGTPYRIGYAHSADGENWTRDHTKYTLDISLEGWDNHMVCYPYVFQHNNSLYMLYNGNNYGKSGFGLAKLTL